MFLYEMVAHVCQQELNQESLPVNGKTNHKSFPIKNFAMYNYIGKVSYSKICKYDFCTIYIAM